MHPVTGALRHSMILAILLAALPAIAPAAETPGAGLSLPEAERLALARDAGVEAIRARREALEESAVAEAQLPDPELTLGAMSVPVDTFEIDQEPMTQLQVGVRQKFPPGRSLGLARERTEALATVEEARADARARQVLLALRGAWIERAFVTGAREILSARQSWFRQLKEAALSAYASGRRPQHDLMRIDMELEMLAEQEVALKQAALDQEAALARWLGPAAGAAHPAELPALPAPPPPEAAAAGLGAHPVVVAARREAEAGGIGVTLAEQSYKPGWMVDLTYGYRDALEDGRDLPDMLTAMVSFELPIFPGKRQDRRVAAAAAQARGLRGELADTERMLAGRLAATASRWTSLAERIAVFENRVMPAAEANVVATRQGYRNDTVPFDELVRAEKDLLEVQNRMLRLQADRLLAQAELLYLTGERR